MRRALAFSLAFFLLAGCSTQKAEEEEPAALAEGQSQFYGKVVEAYGNDVTLEMGTLHETAAPAEPAVDGDQLESPPMQGETMGSPPEGGGEERPSMGDTGTSSTERSHTRGTSEEGEWTGGTGGASGTSARQSYRVQLDLTGETASIRIPVGAPVTRTMGEKTMKTTFTQISADNILLVTTQECDGEAVVVAVEIVQ